MRGMSPIVVYILIGLFALLFFIMLANEYLIPLLTP